MHIVACVVLQMGIESFRMCNGKLYRLYFYLPSGNIPRFSDFKTIATINSFNQILLNCGMLPRACVCVKLNGANVVRIAMYQMSRSVTTVLFYIFSTYVVY
jgi:hypothetical protein